MEGGVQGIGDLALTQASASRAKTALAAQGDAGKAAQDFESVFITQMLQPMFEGVGVDPMFGGGHGEDVMRSFMLQEYGKIIAAHGGFGLAPAVRGELIKAQQNR